MIPRSRVAVFVLLLCAAAGCDKAEDVSAGERRQIADSLQALITNAYDFSKPDAAGRLLSLYPDSGRVISAAAGNVTTTRPALETEIKGFWERVGQNMQGPTFVLGSAYVDVITRNAAVMTLVYSIPHKTPRGMPHTVSGAWTALWRRQNGRWMIVQEHLSDTPQSTAPSGGELMDTTAMPGMTMPGMSMPGTPTPAPKPGTAPGKRPPEH